MTALAVMGLVPDPPGKVTSGSIRIAGQELVGMDAESLRRIRGKDIGMIFQEPMTSLNPVFTVGEQIAESVRLHENASPKAAMSRAVEMLRAVEIPEPELRAKAYPHQLSGGMRQRVMIAIALACRPRVLIADEPTTALDATVQAQIFDLLQDLQEETGTAIILITHDMGAIAELADTVAVMYAGRVVERDRSETVLSAPRHPYTRGLIDCVPHLEPDPPCRAQRPRRGPRRRACADRSGAGMRVRAALLRKIAVLHEAKPVLTETGWAPTACWVTTAETTRASSERLGADDDGALVVEDLKVYFGGAQPSSDKTHRGARGRRRQLPGPAGNDLRHRRRERIGQDHHRARHHASGSHHGRARHARRYRHQRS